MTAMGHRVALTSSFNLRFIMAVWFSLWLCISPHAQEVNLPLKGPKQSDSQYSGTVYGPITDQDTLWRVADRYRQNPSLSVYQVMVAIYELNPNAFEQNNLNLLVNGSMLKLPSERYVARIDAEKAKQRAANDDQAFARMTRKPGDSLRNLKPPKPLVNQDDLDTTKRALEGQLTRLDEEQTRQFEALRQQFALSMTNVEQMLDENRKLFGRLDQVNEQLQTLRVQVESDVQQQIDQQTLLQKQLLAMMQEERDARRTAEASEWLSGNGLSILLISLSGLVTLGLVAGVLVWLRRNKSTTPSSKPVTTTDTPVDKSFEVPASAAAPVAAVAAAVAAPAMMDDVFDEISDDELFNDDELLDDVLSTELEEALDSELESFTELDDDMLVPEDDPFEGGSGVLDQDDLDSLFDEEGMGAEFDTPTESFDSIDLSDDAEPLEDQLAGLDDLDDLDDADEEQTPPSAAPPNPISQVSEQQEKPEISIDDLLGEEDIDLLSDSTIEEDEEVDLLDDVSYEKLNNELSQQSEQLDRMTDDLLAEIDQLEMMGALGEDFDEEPSDPLGDELLAELSEQEALNDKQLDVLSDELVAELEQTVDENVAEKSEDPAPVTASEASTAAILDDLPGLDDWLSDEQSDNDDNDIDELNGLEFDELLSAIDNDTPAEKPSSEKLENIVDIDALLDDDLEAGEDTSDNPGDSFIDVESLLEDAGDDNELDDAPLNIDVDFGLASSGEELLDVDLDSTQAANLDLARVYLEMDDTDAAKDLLDEVIQQGNEEQQQEARDLLATLG